MPRRKPGVIDLHAIDRDSLVSTVDDGDFRRGVAQDCSLFQRFSQRMTVVRIAWHRARANDQSFLAGRRD
jgi:hypothetical protein